MFRSAPKPSLPDQHQNNDVYVLGGYIQVKTGMSGSVSAQGSFRHVVKEELQTALVDACNNPILALSERCPHILIEVLRKSIYFNQLNKDEVRLCFPPNKFVMRKYTDAESRQLSNILNSIIEKKPFYQYFQQWCQYGFLSFRTENEAIEVAKSFRYVSAGDEETYLPALYRATCLKPDQVEFKQYDDHVCCAPIQLQDLRITAGKGIYYGNNADIEIDLAMTNNTMDFIQLSQINITRTVYVLSELICLNRGTNLEISNIFSSDDLCDVFPNSSSVQIYTNLDEAKQAQRKTRINQLVETVDSYDIQNNFNPKGFDYRPRLASVIFEVKLNRNMSFDPAASVHEIDFECIDKSKAVKVINCEKEKDFPSENMPASINISGIERKRSCTIC